MKKTHRRRSLAAVATAIACVTTLGSPAAATTTIHFASVDAGVITLTKTGITPEVDDLAPATPSCSGTAMTLETNAANTTMSVAGYLLSYVRPYGTTGTFLGVQTDSTSGGSAGSLNSTVTPHTVTNMRVGIVTTFYNTTSCTPTGTPICTLATILQMSGTTTSLSTSTTFSFTGTSVGTLVAFPSCSAGPAYLIGSTSSVTTPLTGQLVLV